MALACPPLLRHLAHFSLQQCLICLQNVDALVTLHAPNNFPHQLCQSCLNTMISQQATRCPFCRQFVAFVRIPSPPLCSFCHLALAAFHCFNPQCVTGPTSTPICNSCSRTPYYLTHSICPSCAGPRPIPYHE